MKSIHGHEVIDFLRETTSTRENAVTNIEEHFGKIQFHTCSREGMTAKELIEFLEQKGKINFSTGTTTINEKNICQH